MADVSVEGEDYMLGATPTQPDALGEKSEPIQAIKVAKESSLPAASTLAHLLAAIVSGVIALFVGCVLADGRSVIVLKPARDLPRITDMQYKKFGLDYRADELLGPTYGIGLHHDSSGYTWTETGAEASLKEYIEQLGLHQVIAAVPSVIASDGLKHPVEFLECRELQKAGLSAMGLGFVAEVVACLMIIVHGAALAGLLKPLGATIAKVLCLLIWLTLTAGFMIVIGLGLGIMDNEWTCDNPFVPKIVLSDHFEFSYGIGFAYAGFISSLLIFAVMLFFTSTTGAEVSSATGAAGKSFGVVTVGLVVCAAISLAVAGGEDAFSDTEVDMSVNICAGQKPYHAGPGDNYFDNTECVKDGVVQVLEQAGANVTKGYKGGLDAGIWRVPITKMYKDTDLCPVNVHWHLGAEHLSVGQFDKSGKGPINPQSDMDMCGESTEEHVADGTDKTESGCERRRELAAKKERLGFRCHHFDATDSKFTTPYEWKYCDKSMKVGETYEVHWPHSAAGACGTKWQYQSPFYDGVFCNDGIINILTPLNTFKKIGVQAQIFTIVNDESYYTPDLFSGMHVDPYTGHGQDIAMYTGSTTGTTRNNEVCSRYAPVTWQVDRKCHLVSAKSFDDMCKVMRDQADDMSGDTHAHGAREVVAHHLTANNQQS